MVRAYLVLRSADRFAHAWQHRYRPVAPIVAADDVDELFTSFDGLSPYAVMTTRCLGAGVSSGLVGYY